MTIEIDEAIKHCEEVADGLDETAQEIAMQDENGIYQPRVLWYQDRASSQRQIAEWLKELKEYKNERVGCEFCKHKFREPHERPCSLCSHNFKDMFETGEV